jgi:hypothetical protein
MLRAEALDALPGIFPSETEAADANAVPIKEKLTT